MAQIPTDMHLAVHPRAMATGTTNPAAGEYPLDSVAGAIVSVPPQCVGARRCPLLVQLPGGSQPAAVITRWMRPVANTYGFVLLAISADSSDIPAHVGAALREVLQRFAIDPARLAIAGRCATAGTAMLYGIQNLPIFTRIISISGGVPVAGMDPQNRTAEFFIDRGIHEVFDNFPAAQALRQGGHPVTVVLAVREHEHQREDYDVVGHWLVQSWAQPNPAARPQPVVVADPLPVLTSDVLAKLTAFWTRFATEPAAIRLTARRAHLRAVRVPVGQEQAVVWMTNMPAFAARYPTVAADLKRAGLTARQHDAYRVALLSAMVTAEGGKGIGTVDTASVLARNMAFLRAHPDEVKALTLAGVQDPAQFAGLSQRIQGCCTEPAQIDQLGSLGIWRTP